MSVLVNLQPIPSHRSQLSYDLSISVSLFVSLSFSLSLPLSLSLSLSSGGSVMLKIPVGPLASVSEETPTLINFLIYQ